MDGPTEIRVLGAAGDYWTAVPKSDLQDRSNHCRGITLRGTRCKRYVGSQTESRLPEYSGKGIVTVYQSKRSSVCHLISYHCWQHTQQFDHCSDLRPRDSNIKGESICSQKQTAEIRKLVSENDSLTAKVECKDSKIKKQREKIDAQKDEIEEQFAEIREQLSTINRQNSKLKAKQVYIREQSTEIETKDARIKAQSAEIEDLKAIIAALTSQLTDLATKNETPTVTAQGQSKPRPSVPPNAPSVIQNKQSRPKESATSQLVEKPGPSQSGLSSARGGKEAQDDGTAAPADLDFEGSKDTMDSWKLGSLLEAGVKAKKRASLRSILTCGWCGEESEDE